MTSLDTLVAVDADTQNVQAPERRPTPAPARAPGAGRRSHPPSEAAGAVADQDGAVEPPPMAEPVQEEPAVTAPSVDTSPAQRDAAGTSAARAEGMPVASAVGPKANDGDSTPEAIEWGWSPSPLDLQGSGIDLAAMTQSATVSAPEETPQPATPSPASKFTPGAMSPASRTSGTRKSLPATNPTPAAPSGDAPSRAASPRPPRVLASDDQMAKRRRRHAEAPPASPSAPVGTAERCQQVYRTLSDQTCTLNPAEREAEMRDALQLLLDNATLPDMVQGEFTRGLYRADPVAYRAVIDAHLDRGVMHMVLTLPWGVRTAANVAHLLRPVFVADLQISTGSDQVLLDLAFVALQNYAGAMHEVNAAEQLGEVRPPQLAAAHAKIKAHAAAHLRDYRSAIEQLSRRGQPQLKLTQNNVNINIEHPSNGQCSGRKDTIAGEAEPCLSSSGGTNDGTHAEVEDGRHG